MEQQSKSELMVLRDYLNAVLAVRRARTIFLVVVILTLLIHMGAYATARWGSRVTDRVSKVRQGGGLSSLGLVGSQAVSSQSATAATTQDVAKTPTTTIASARPGDDLINEKTPVVDPRTGKLFKEDVLAIVLSISRFVGLTASVLLMLTYLIGVNVCLGGRMGGICHATSAFFWSIVLIALVFPWRDIIPGAALDVPNALYDLEQIRRGLRVACGDTLAMTLHYGRFFGCPILAMLVAIVSGVRFGRAYRQVRLAVEPLVLMKVV